MLNSTQQETIDNVLKAARAAPVDNDPLTASRKSEKKKRPCLACNENFISEGIHNRLCRACKIRGCAPSFDRPGARKGNKGDIG